MKTKDQIEKLIKNPHYKLNPQDIELIKEKEEQEEFEEVKKQKNVVKKSKSSFKKTKGLESEES